VKTCDTQIVFRKPQLSITAGGFFNEKGSHQRCSTTINRYNPRRFSLAIRPLIFFEIPHGQ